MEQEEEAQQHLHDVANPIWYVTSFRVHVFVPTGHCPVALQTSPHIFRYVLRNHARSEIVSF